MTDSQKLDKILETVTAIAAQGGPDPNLLPGTVEVGPDGHTLKVTLGPQASGEVIAGRLAPNAAEVKVFTYWGWTPVDPNNLGGSWKHTDGSPAHWDKAFGVLRR